jgi:hypothetical protein
VVADVGHRREFGDPRRHRQRQLADYEAAAPVEDGVVDALEALDESDEELDDDPADSDEVEDDEEEDEDEEPEPLESVL